MQKIVREILQYESGGVTVDWVVISAAVIALGLSVISAIATDSEAVASSSIATAVSELND